MHKFRRFYEKKIVEYSCFLLYYYQDKKNFKALIKKVRISGG